MKGASHRLLANYLAQRYMSDLPDRYVMAFRIGCIEPDQNPATYFKGSIRCQWLRGHNWGNTEHYMRRISRHLECRKKYNLYDYYTLGKLIHYTTDAFTLAHNPEFPSNLHDHRIYEKTLQQYFLHYLPSCTLSAKSVTENDVMNTIRLFHMDYRQHACGVHTDSRFTVIVCNLVMSMLMRQK